MFTRPTPPLPEPGKKEEAKAPEVQAPGLPEKDELWRRKQYLRMGFNQINAFLLANDRGLDWHRVHDELERGMTHDDAVRIFS